jgi:hypothetical protein
MGLVNVEEDYDKSIDKAASLLPTWIKPQWIYPWKSISKSYMLGSGEYGIVFKGTYSHGTAM